MHIFVTGATGTLGSAVIPKLLARGHTVSGLARSQKNIDALLTLGVQPIQGTITDLGICHAAAKEADGVIHLAFDKDKALTGQMVQACEVDRALISALCEGLLGSQSSEKVFIYTPGALGTPKESDPVVKLEHLPRYKSTELIQSYIAKGLRGGDVRLGAVTFGPDSPHPMIGGPVPKYKELGAVLYPEGGFWPACDASDAADLIVLAIENDKLPRPLTLHAVTEAPSIKSTAEAIGQKLGLPTRAAEGAELQQNLGFVGAVMMLGHPVSNEWTKEVTGWKPHGKTLLEQIEDWSF
jgi:nucleoside-diphosphate-sugar epimerase